MYCIRLLGLGGGDAIYPKREWSSLTLSPSANADTNSRQNSRGTSANKSARQNIKRVRAKISQKDSAKNFRTSAQCQHDALPHTVPPSVLLGGRRLLAWIYPVGWPQPMMTRSCSLRGQSLENSALSLCILAVDALARPCMYIYISIHKHIYIHV